MKAVAAHSFAGGFDLGVKLAGWEIVGKNEGSAGFGSENVRSNQDLLGDFPVVDLDPSEWKAMQADMVYGNPPCSGFSALSVYQRVADGDFRDGRGVDSHLNQGMYDLIGYASRVRPRAVVFESVETGGRAKGAGGRSLMQKLRKMIEDETGLEWDLTHVFQDCASVGGSAIRRRYFMVLTQSGITLGMPERPIAHVPTLAETIAGSHLQGGHVVFDNETTRNVARIARLSREMGSMWQEGEKVGHVVCRLGKGDEILTKTAQQGDHAVSHIPAMCYECADLAREFEKAGKVFDRVADAPHPKLGADLSWVQNIHWKSNLYAARRWRGDRPAWVVTGTFLEDGCHPYEDRTFTYREQARIMGFPDTWDLTAAMEQRHGWKWFGKGIPVQAGQWVAQGVLESLEGSPGPVRAVEIGPREYELDVIGKFRSGGVLADPQMGMFG